jgi:hypothetical protein
MPVDMTSVGMGVKEDVPEAAGFFHHSFGTTNARLDNATWE